MVFSLTGFLDDLRPLHLDCVHSVLYMCVLTTSCVTGLAEHPPELKVSRWAFARYSQPLESVPVSLLLSGQKLGNLAVVLYCRKALDNH